MTSWNPVYYETPSAPIPNPGNSMSWIFGVWSRYPTEVDTSVFSRCHDRPLHTYYSRGIYLAAGGIDETCHLHFPSTPDDPGWVVVGTGLEWKDRRVTILTKENWGSRLSPSVNAATSRLEMLDGHFVIIRWTPNEISIRCDQLGQRTLYYVETEKEILFSTRLDWLAQVTGKTEIDLDAFGSRWLTYNQLSYDSCIKGIGRVGPGGQVVFPKGVSARTSFAYWNPGFSNGRVETAIETLEGFTSAALSQPQKLALGLSGGMDSRFLLAILTRKTERDFGVYSFGDPEDPDVAIAMELAQRLGRTHTLFNDPLPSLDQCLDRIKAYVAQTQLIEPAASGVRLGYYDRLYAEGRMMIDGGFGELSRRQYLNRAATFGSSAIEGGDVNGILKHLRVPRGQIFLPDVMAMLERGTVNALRVLLDAMPSPRDIGIGNFVDLLAVRTRVPNFGAPEQARLDCALLNFMPLVQPSFLREVFALDLRYRKNARLQKDYIVRHARMLTRLPLVKGGSTYRFGLPLAAVHAVTVAKMKMGRCYRDRSTEMFLKNAEEFIRDLVASARVSSCPLYDMSTIRKAVNAHYSGVPGHAGTVHWWLTFEFWRNSLKKGG
jgi:hypothetical protein